MYASKVWQGSLSGLIRKIIGALISSLVFLYLLVEVHKTYISGKVA
jgi:hypothetical protein